MKESVKNFIEENIIALDEEDIVFFLYLAAVRLSKQDIDILCSYLDTAGIDYEEHIPSVIEELVKDNVALQYRGKVKLSNIVAAIPEFNYTDYTGIRTAVANAIRKVYPDKIIRPDRYSGIEYVMERV